MKENKLWTEFREAEMKRQRKFDRCIGAIFGMLVLGLVLLAPGCLECFGEGAIWEPIFQRNPPTMRLVP